MRLIKLALICLVIALTGCASGVKYKDMGSSIATLQPDQGRVYFYRTSIVGAAIQPDIKLDKTAVGTSKPEGFFYIDTKPGNHLVSTATEVERELTFNLDAGETKYVRTAISLGFFVGHVTPELVSPGEALKELREMKYIGNVAQIRQSGNTDVSSAKSTPAVAVATSTNRPVVASNPPKSQPAESQAVQTYAVINTPPPITHVSRPVQEASNVDFKLGTSSNTVERMGKYHGCESQQGAGLIAGNGAVEYYKMSCEDGSAYLAKCELRQCTQIQE